MRRCELCGATTNKKRKRSTIERHHISYKPSIVVDLCASCHAIVSNYERNPDVYNIDEPRFKVLKRYDELKETKQAEEREGTHILSIRLTNSVMYTIDQMAGKKWMTVSAFVKGKVEEYARLANETVNTTKPKEYVVIGGVRYKKPG